MVRFRCFQVCCADKEVVPADIFPLWLDNLYVASQEFEPNAGHEAFLWASRDIWMTNMTMHADSLPHKTADNPPRLLLRGETEAYNSTGGTTVGAVWADDHVLAEGTTHLIILLTKLDLPICVLHVSVSRTWLTLSLL